MNAVPNDPALWHRIQFAFTIAYHYLFPPLTMGLVASSAKSLQLGLLWWPLALLLSIAYFVFISRHCSGKVKVSEDTQGYY